MLRTAEGAAGFDARLARLLRGVPSGTPTELRAELTALEAGLPDLPALLEPLRRLAADEHRPLARLLREHPLSVDQLERDVCRASAERGLKAHALDVLAGGDWDALREDALRSGAGLRRANAEAIVERARNGFLAHVALSLAPADTLRPEQKREKKALATGRKELEHEFGKTTRYRSIRDLATGNPGVVVRDLKPIWLMSPLSVADTLPLEPAFDLVIFDEASQIPLEDAVPAAYRAAQTIVVGDEMQLPPTDFFGSGHVDAEEPERAEEPGYELDAQSLLTHATRALPSTMLGWHYRSRDEALIAFSNRVFYEGKLMTVPSVSSAVPRPPILVREASDGAAGAEALLERSISFHRLEASPYEQRRNAGEARYIAALLRGLLAKNDGKTIGVVAFSEAQQGEIEAAIAALGEEDPAFAARYEAELEREEAGQHVGLFVKNLENVQGDERDIIVISVCYGPDPRGKMLMNFGPINKTGGEKRLNVIFSRARHHLAVVSSIRWPAITNDYNDGARCLRNYLRYAEAMSAGALDEANLALQSYGARVASAPQHGASTLDARLARALRERGYEVELGVGTSQFRCNLGVRRKGEHRYRLGVLLDDAAQQARAVEEVLHAQASVLQGFGWKTLTVLHRDWYAGPELVLQRLEAALADAAG
jgi:predicted N-acetyltransferase YhbS